ncbi:protein kinase domain-containing protein [Nocardiopsis nanhaiensis]
MNGDDVYETTVRDAVYRVPEAAANNRADLEVECRLTPLRDLSPSTVPFLGRRLVRVEAQGRESTLLQLWVGGTEDDGDERAEAFDRLDNAILAGVRLARASAGGTYPPELTRLVGYHDDPVAPFALLTPYQGQPVRTLLGRRQLFDEEREAFRHGLLLALERLQAAEVVHRGLSPSTVCWNPDRGTVHVYDFTLATVRGALRTRTGTEPWSSPEQRDGSGRCDPRDDVWSAGLILFQTLTGHRVERGEQLPVDTFPGVSADLRGVFEAEAAHRPDAAELLERLTGAATSPRGIDDHLSPEIRLFYRRLAQKRGEDADPGGEAPTVPDPGSAPAPIHPLWERARRNWPLLTVAALLVLVTAVALSNILGG